MKQPLVVASVRKVHLAASMGLLVLPLTVIHSLVLVQNAGLRLLAPLVERTLQLQRRQLTDDLSYLRFQRRKATGFHISRNVAVTSFAKAVGDAGVGTHLELRYFVRIHDSIVIS